MGARLAPAAQACGPAPPSAGPLGGDRGVHLVHVEALDGPDQLVERCGGSAPGWEKTSTPSRNAISVGIEVMFAARGQRLLGLGVDLGEHDVRVAPRTPSRRWARTGGTGRTTPPRSPRARCRCRRRSSRRPRRSAVVVATMGSLCLGCVRSGWLTITVARMFRDREPTTRLHRLPGVRPRAARAPLVTNGVRHVHADRGCGGSAGLGGRAPLPVVRRVPRTWTSIGPAFLLNAVGGAGDRRAAGARGGTGCPAFLAARLRRRPRSARSSSRRPSGCSACTSTGWAGRSGRRPSPRSSRSSAGCAAAGCATLPAALTPVSLQHRLCPAVVRTSTEAMSRAAQRRSRR